MTGGRSPPLARGSQHDRAVDELELELSPLLQAEFQAKGGRQGEPAVVVQLQGRHLILSGSLKEPQAASRRIGRPGGLVTSPVRCPSMWCASGGSVTAIGRRDAAPIQQLRSNRRCGITAADNKMYARDTPSPHGRTRMIVFPPRPRVGLRAARASSGVELLPLFARSPPSPPRRTISPSWARSDSTTKSTAEP